MPDVQREVDRAHAAHAELPNDLVSFGNRRREAGIELHAWLLYFLSAASLSRNSRRQLCTITAFPHASVPFTISSRVPSGLMS